MPDSLDTGWTPRPALRACLASLAVLLAPVAPAAATPELRGGGQFRRPVQVAAPPGDQRLFVVEQAGRVRVLGAHGTLAAKPFLDLSAQTIIGDERGLVGLAFAADYATSGEFFVFLTVKQPEGQVQVRRYRVSTADPNRADPASGVTILRQDHARPTHNGGGLRVGPDGKLWASLGDGSISNDDLDNGQNRQTLPGKLLRLERDGSPAAGNPFLGATDGTRPEIWQYGLRNAFRFSFDRATGDLVLGDVGESAREEIDLAPAAENRLPGANWGWPCFEGLRPNRPCSAPGAVAPVIDFDHARDGVRAIAGGVVVRDPGLPTLAGRYLYGDLGYDRLHSVALAKRADRPERSLRLPVVVSVDEDGCGRVVVSSVQGRVARVVDGSISRCASSTVTPAVPAAPGCGLVADTASRRSRRGVIRDGILVRLSVRTRCALELRLRAGGASGPVHALKLLPGARRVVPLRVSVAVRHALRRRVTVRTLATSHGRSVRRTLTVRLRHGDL